MALSNEKWIRIRNNKAFKAINAASSGTVDMFKVDASDILQLLGTVHYGSYEIANKDYVDTGLSSKMNSAARGAPSGVASLDANSLIPIAQIPPAAIERLVIVADQTARYALTIATVQIGDTVKQTDTKEMWFVVDDTKLDQAAGYVVYSAGTASSVAWSGVTSTPTTLAGYAISDAVPSSRTVNGHALSSDVSVTKTDVGLSAVTNDAQLKAADLDTDTTLAANSDSKIASQKATKAYVDSAVGGITLPVNANEVITLITADITAGYKDLAHTIKAGSLNLCPVGGPKQTSGVDYTISTVSSKTRVTFAADLLTLEAGDQLDVSYQY